MRMYNFKLSYFFLLFLLLFALYSVASFAQKVELVGLKGHWDTTTSLGATWRVEEQRDDLLAIDNCTGSCAPYLLMGLKGYATQINKNDGNVNHNKGVVSEVLKLTTELDLADDNWGVFLRGTAFYDRIIMRGGHDGGVRFSSQNPNNGFGNDYSDDAERYAGNELEMLDAYVWTDMDIGGKPLNLRLGRQVISWGEALFLQDGVNAANPLELVQLKLPGAEIKDAFKPLASLYGQYGLSDTVSLEAFVQFEWDHSDDAPAGTFWSTHDAFPGQGADNILIDGHALAIRRDPAGPGSSLYDSIVEAVRLYNSASYGVNPDDPLTFNRFQTDPHQLTIDRGNDEDARDDGQFGLALRWYAEELNDTEFGFYFMNYHSHLPVAASRGGAPFGAVIDSSTLGAVQTALSAQGNVPAANALTGLTAEQLVDILGCSVSISSPDCDSVDSRLLPGLNPAIGSPVAQTIGLFNVLYQIDTTSYFMYYPEDIRLYGLSFNTSVGNLSVAGELAYRPEHPIINEVGDNLVAGLAGAASELANNPNGQAFVTLHCIHLYSPEAGCSTAPLRNGMTAYFYDEVQTWNASVVTIMNLGPKFNTDGLYTVLELGATHVGNLRAGLSGLKYNSTAGLLNVPASGITESGFSYASYLTANSWGYRVILKADYNDAFSGVNLTPSIRLAHDVEGNSYQGGNFLEGRKSISYGVDGLYLNNLNVALAYTIFWGAGFSNKLNDRDNAVLSVKYSF